MMNGVPPAHVLENFDEDLEVSEAADMAAGQRFAEIGGDRLGQRAIGIAGQNLHLAGHSLFSNARSERALARARRVIAAARRSNNMTLVSRRAFAGRLSTRKAYCA